MAAPPDAATGSRAPLIGDSSRAPQKRQNPQKLRRSRPGALGSRLLRPPTTPGWFASRRRTMRRTSSGSSSHYRHPLKERMSEDNKAVIRRLVPEGDTVVAGSPARPPTSGNGAVMLHRAALRAGRRGRHLPPPGRQDRRGLVFGGLPVPPSAARLVHGTAPGRREFPRHRSEPCRSRRSFPTLKRSTT